jgi:hypothetical protein
MSGGIRNRQTEIKSTAFAYLTFDPYLALMLADDLGAEV